jgi:SAM-dependent methyltransferase
MENGGMTRQDLKTSLTGYLQSWGLREFHDEAGYYEWQRQALPPQDLQLLQSLVEQRQGGEHVQADIQFYDLLAKPPLLSVLYSQRFDYFRQIGLLLTPRILSAEYVLDFGCGVGILTCFFAQQYPHVQFVGIDRSAKSIEKAQDEAKKRHIPNVQFRVSEDLSVSPLDIYDCILSTQVLLQCEREPGLPSRNWRTFEREHDLSRQEALESRTGLTRRLDLLLNALSSDGRLICFEKTWNLGRRIFFQRALSGRKLFLVCNPVPCSYHELGELRTDGPVYEVSRFVVSEQRAWNENPYYGEGDSLYRCAGDIAERMGREFTRTQQSEMIRGQHANFGLWSIQCGVWEEALAWGLCKTASGFHGLLLASAEERTLVFSLLENVRGLTDIGFEEFIRNGWGHLEDVPQNTYSPGYENHLPFSQRIYEALPRKIIQQESTFSEGQGREMHIEVGTSDAFRYLYWANTLDQRQLLLIDEIGAEILQAYYQESLESAQNPS